MLVPLRTSDPMALSHKVLIQPVEYASKTLHMQLVSLRSKKFCLDSGTKTPCISGLLIGFWGYTQARVTNVGFQEKKLQEVPTAGQVN